MESNDIKTMSYEEAKAEQAKLRSEAFNDGASAANGLKDTQAYKRLIAVNQRVAELEAQALKVARNEKLDKLIAEQKAEMEREKFLRSRRSLRARGI
jgi:hypothetical protein